MSLEINIEKLKYPIGDFKFPDTIDHSLLADWISTIKAFPDKISAICNNLNDTQKNWTYRPDGWTLKQVVHHCADSHTNSMIRYKWTLTEEAPLIKAYFEDRWAKLYDSHSEDLSLSIDLLKALHRKWGFLLDAMSTDDFKRTFKHPETGRTWTLEELTGLYAWHCNHHEAHIKNALSAEGRYN